MKSLRLFSLILLTAGALTPTIGRAQTPQDALKLLAYEKYGAARTAFTSAYSSSATPENAYYLGNFYIAVGQPDSARTIFEQALTTNEKAPLLHVGMGELALINKNGTEAEEHFEQAEKLSKKKNAEVFFREGLAYLRSSEDYNEAVDALDQAMKIDGKNPAYYTALGDAYLELNDAGKATLQYEQAVYFDPTYAPAYSRAADVYVRAKQYTEAIKRYLQAVETDPNYAPAYREMAELYYLGRQYGNAAEAISKYIELGQGTREDMASLAGYQYLNNQYQGSLQTLEHVGTDYPNPIVHRLYAYNYYRTEQNQPGFERINAFLQKAKPEDILADDYEIHGRLGLATGADTAAALASLRKAAEMDTSKVGLLRDVAQTLYSQRDYLAAAQEYGNLTAKGVELNATDRFRQGQAYYFAKDFPKAIEAFTFVTESAASNPLGWLYVARANAQLDPKSEQGLAKPAYEKYIEVADPEKNKRELTEANFYLGYHAYLTSNKEVAEMHLGKVLTIDPAHENAKMLMDAIAAGQIGVISGDSQQ